MSGSGQVPLFPKYGGELRPLPDDPLCHGREWNFIFFL